MIALAIGPHYAAPPALRNKSTAYLGTPSFDALTWRH